MNNCDTLIDSLIARVYSVKASYHSYRERLADREGDKIGAFEHRLSYMHSLSNCRCLLR